MELLGKIKLINETKEYGSNGFRKRELVITTEEQYPQHILIEFIQDKCDLLNNFQVAQRVKIGINIRGREWQSPQGETKFFNAIQGWRIEAFDTAPAAPTESFEPLNESPEESPDDLPF